MNEPPTSPEPRLGRRAFLYRVVGTTILGGAGLAAAIAAAGDDEPGTAADTTTPATTPRPLDPAPSTTLGATDATTPRLDGSADDPMLDLPQPDGPPADAYADVPIQQIGAISIPRIGLEHAVYEGVWLTVLDEGPGHWPGSALPGQVGNTVFPGHRVTHSHPFRRLDELVPGDEIVFTIANGTHTYTVRETLIVSPKDLWVVDPTSSPEVTLVACHPPHSARQRIVVKGDLQHSRPNAAAGNAARQIADAAAAIPL